MKPMIKYRGGKSKEIPQIMKYIPSCSGRYIEPFFGGGALFFCIEPQKAVINDINDKLMNFYRGVRDDYSDLRRELDELEHLYTLNRKEYEIRKVHFPKERVADKNEDLYYRLRAMFNGTAEKAYSDAALYYYINKTAYSGMIRYNASGEFNVPFGRYKNLNTKSVTLKHSCLLQHAEILNTDYGKVFDLCKPDDFVFLDPPYDCVFSDYGNKEHQKDGFIEKDHRRLASDFRNLPCKALMVIGKTPLTESLYGDYIVDEYAKAYAVNIRNRFKSEARHIVVANFEIARESRSICPQYHGIDKGNDAYQLRLFEKTQTYGSSK